MTSFPDESKLPKSEVSGDVIRGGSIGLNRILNHLVDHAAKDHKPEFTAVLMSAFTVFRNVWAMKGDPKDYEADFVKDINLFLEYYNTYLSFTKSRLASGKYCPVLIYFPDYHWVEKDLLRSPEGQRGELLKAYYAFFKKANPKDELARKLEHTRGFWITAGLATYPHKEVARKFKDITFNQSSLYSPGDPIALMSHILLDYHISKRLRGIHSLESYTGELKSSDQFKFRLDKEGRVPFNTVMHLIFGDSAMLKPMVTPKIKKLILDHAEKEHWVSRSEADIQNRVSKIADIPLKELRKYDFV